MNGDKLTTVLHAYYFNLEKPEEKAAYHALRDKLTAEGLECFETWGGDGSHYMPQLDGETLTLETTHLFNNQWNTGPTSDSKKGWRVFDWAQDYMPDGWNKKIKKGHYLEQTPAMKEIRRNTTTCRYCGKQEPAQKGYVFCPHCIGSEYLKESDLHLTRMVSVDETGGHNFPELTTAEKAHLLPLYKEAQLHGHTERDKARIAKQRRDIEDDYTKRTRNARAERDGLIWLMDHGIKTDNVIYYNHTEKFCFGWRKPLEAELKSALLDILSEFPFDYEFDEKKRSY